MGFGPAVSRDAVIAMGRTIRSWRIGRRSDLSLNDLADTINSVVRGWINYYGRFYMSAPYPLLQRIKEHLVRWACSGPSTATRSGRAVVTDSTAPVSQSRRSPRVPFTAAGRAARKSTSAG